MDRLEDLLARQKKLQRVFGNNFEKMTDADRQQYTKDNVLGLLDEIHEVLREINWKKWKKTEKPVSKDKLLEELADALHFYFNLVLVWGFSAEDLYNAYIKKDKIIYNRIEKGY